MIYTRGVMYTILRVCLGRGNGGGDSSPAVTRRGLCGRVVPLAPYESMVTEVVLGELGEVLRLIGPDVPEHDLVEVEDAADPGELASRVGGMELFRITRR